ncbi:MAG: hypothetical protein GQ562_08620 [Anaerolineales bacterium]|nr:hypothetical protein [Anaerolineales bacterium]
MFSRILPLIFILLILASCTPESAISEPEQLPPDTIESPQPTETQPPEDTLPPQTSLDPLEWLRDQPFQPGKEEPAQLILSDLPEGFQAQDPESSSGDMMEEGIAYITRLQYQNPDNGQVSSENTVDVHIFSYEIIETRNAHLDLIESQEYQWEFQPISGDLVARYYTSSTDGRAWISGPHLIVIYSGLNDSPSNLWVVEFTEMYLELYPLQ